MSLSVGYVGTRGMRLPVFVDANLIGQTPHGLRTYDVLNASNNVIKQLTVPVYLPVGPPQHRHRHLSTPASAWPTPGTTRWPPPSAVPSQRPRSLANYTWAHATDTGQVGGANGTFYGGDTPLDPNNIRRENGLSDTDIRNRFTLSFVYQPQLFEDNKSSSTSSTTSSSPARDIASGGQPIFLGMSGTVYSGSPAPPATATDGNIYGGAISSGSGSPPPAVLRRSVATASTGPASTTSTSASRATSPSTRRSISSSRRTPSTCSTTQIVTGVNGTYSQYAAATSSATAACSTSPTSATGGTVPSGSALQGCISPYTGTGLQAFGVTSGTNNSLYGPRQLQVSGKLFF